MEKCGDTIVVLVGVLFLGSKRVNNHLIPGIGACHGQAEGDDPDAVFLVLRGGSKFHTM